MRTIQNSIFQVEEINCFWSNPMDIDGKKIWSRRLNLDIIFKKDMSVHEQLNPTDSGMDLL